MKKWSDDNPKAALMERKRAAIVAAARQAFLENGYAEASMDRIAESGAVSVKTASPAARFTWFERGPRRGLAAAGRDYLRHLLSAEQLALYRVVTRDAHRFPELGRRYEKEVVATRTNIMSQYLTRWAPVENWRIKNPDRASSVFAALLRAGVFEEVLHGLRIPEERTIAQQARSAAELFSKLLQLGAL